MIHKLFTIVDPILVGSILGTVLLVPFTYFVFDVKKNPKNYSEE